MGKLKSRKGQDLLTEAAAAGSPDKAKRKG